MVKKKKTIELMNKYLLLVILFPLFLAIISCVHEDEENSGIRESVLVNDCVKYKKEIQFSGKIIRVTQSPWGERTACLVVMQDESDGKDSLIGTIKCAMLKRKSGKIFLKIKNRSTYTNDFDISINAYYLIKKKGKEEVEVLDKERNLLYTFPIFDGYIE